MNNNEQHKISSCLIKTISFLFCWNTLQMLLRFTWLQINANLWGKSLVKSWAYKTEEWCRVEVTGEKEIRVVWSWHVRHYMEGVRDCVFGNKWFGPGGMQMSILWNTIVQDAIHTQWKQPRSPWCVRSLWASWWWWWWCWVNNGMFSISEVEV